MREPQSVSAYKLTEDGWMDGLSVYVTIPGHCLRRDTLDFCLCAVIGECQGELCCVRTIAGLGQSRLWTFWSRPARYNPEQMMCQLPLLMCI